MAAPTPNSATAGYLRPTAPPILYDDALEDLLHDVIMGITGLDGKLVRPRFQKNPPNIPDFGVTWVAFGVTESEKDWNPYHAHSPAANGGDGASTTVRAQAFTVLLSFYGPTAKAAQEAWEDGIIIPQNREVLIRDGGIRWQENSRATRLPALVKEQWVNRWDQRSHFGRLIRRTVPILNLIDASVRSLDNESYLTDITTEQPSSP